MTLVIDIDLATVADVDGLQQLYSAVYGPHYHITLGTCPQTMARTLADADISWLAARHSPTGRIVGSALLRSDPVNRIGRLEGVVVHPEHRGARLAKRMIDPLCSAALGPRGALDSVYAASRTAAPGPQRTLLALGFRPLGLLPGATRFRRREHIALLARHRDGVLARRRPPERVIAGIQPLVRTVERATGIDLGMRREPAVPREPAAVGVALERGASAQTDLEWIEAAGFVRRRLSQAVSDGDRPFYPFHEPNTLLTSTDGATEAYVAMDRNLKTCALVGSASGAATAGPMLEPLIEMVETAGARYVEALLPLNDHAALRGFLAHDFVPSALYPAMRRVGDTFEDYAVVSRPLCHLDFRELRIDAALRPYADYTAAWTSTCLPTAVEPA